MGCWRLKLVRKWTADFRGKRVAKRTAEERTQNFRAERRVESKWLSSGWCVYFVNGENAYLNFWSPSLGENSEDRRFNFILWRGTIWKIESLTCYIVFLNVSFQPRVCWGRWHLFDDLMFHFKIFKRSEASIINLSQWLTHWLLLSTIVKYISWESKDHCSNMIFQQRLSFQSRFRIDKPGKSQQTVLLIAFWTFRVCVPMCPRCSRWETSICSFFCLGVPLSNITFHRGVISLKHEP